MGENTKIAWTDDSFNPWMGCVKVSDGCTNCYAEEFTRTRMKLSLWGVRGERRRTEAQNWAKPRRWNRKALAAGESSRVFCASLCDVFEDHPVANAARPDLWDLVRETPNLDWQILTKRPENFERMLPSDWDDGYPNVWLGTSIEEACVTHRADYLREIPAEVRFISYEPALGPIAPHLDLEGIDWVIYGGESGGNHRPEDKKWARDMRAACRKAKVAFFHKQSAAGRSGTGIELDGELVQEFPRDRREIVG